MRNANFSLFFFSSRRRHTRSLRDWSSDVCSSDLPQHVPRAVQVRVDEFFREDFGPVDVLVRGEMEDDLGLRRGELSFETARLADVAENVVEAVERLRIAAATIGDQRRLVAVHERDALGPKAAEKSRQRAADRAATAGEQDPSAAEALLQFE